MKMAKSKPRFSTEELHQRLQLYDRTPFLDLLTEFIECAPDTATIVKWAKKYPDRYIQAMATLGRTAGFSDRRESLSLNFNMDVQNMSDSELEDKVQEAKKLIEDQRATARSGKKVNGKGPVIDGEFEEVSTNKK